MRTMKKTAAFTLIELMVAVSILSIGIVAILSSLISLTRALDTSQNHILAIQILGAKMSALEETAFKEKGLLAGVLEEQVRLAGRSADCITEIIPVEEEVYGLTEKEEPPLPTFNVLEATVTLAWQEDNRPKSLCLASFFRERREK